MKKEKSCGCIIIEDNKVLLIQQNKGNWGFPKGHVEENETEMETAIREVKEETNIDVEIVDTKRYNEQYITDRGNEKEVVYFLAKKISGIIKPQETEIRNIEWCGFSDAIKKITYENTTNILKNVLDDKKCEI